MIGLKSRDSQVITLTDPPDTTPLQLLGVEASALAC